MVKKISLPTGRDARAPGAARAESTTSEPNAELCELFLQSGIVFHEVTAVPPDFVSSFVLMEGSSVRRAQPGEEAAVDISALDHVGELAGRWIPVPYQLSAPHAVQMQIKPAQGGAMRILLAIDTATGVPGTPPGDLLDENLDAHRPYRPLTRDELGPFFDHPRTREYVERLSKLGIDRALFKLFALLETFGPLLPKLRLLPRSAAAPIDVSLVLDFGNARSAAVLVEARDEGVLGVPLQLRSFSDPFEVSEESFDSRITFLPSPFDRAFTPIAAQSGFAFPSIARLGKEAVERALEARHRDQVTLSGPKRYLWDGRPTGEPWRFATKIGDDFPTISGRLLKYVADEAHGLGLRQDGPSAPAEPRYAPRTMMMFALVEILTQAYAQIGSFAYRSFVGKEGAPRTLKHLVLTYPSGMSETERQVYDTLVQNAVVLTTYLLGIPGNLRPNFDAESNQFTPFLFADEALAAQMVYLYQEINERFQGKMEDLVALYGRTDADGIGRLRVASIDIGGGTTDVMIGEYEDRLPGSGTALAVKKLFQDGVSVAGDDVCRAIVERVIFPQILQQLPAGAERQRFAHLFDEGDAGLGQSFRTLRSRLVPHLWMPLSRCYWSLLEGKSTAASDSVYVLDDLPKVFGLATPSALFLEEADAQIRAQCPSFPGFRNIMLRFDREAARQAALSVLREPLRKYADILAQFDVDVVVLAGRTTNLQVVEELLLAELPVLPTRLVKLGAYKVGDWYPSKWREHGMVKDPKSAVAAGASIYHLAMHNRLRGFLLDDVAITPMRPIYGLWRDDEPHLVHADELFRDGVVSKPFAYTHGMRIGVRYVDSEEMDGSPLYEVIPASPDMERALLDDRALLRFSLTGEGHIVVSEVVSQRGKFGFEPSDFELRLRTSREERYWLDTGVFTVEVEPEEEAGAAQELA